MIRYIARRILGLVPVFFGITLISFFVMHLAPGKPMDAEMAFNPKVSYEARMRLEKMYGLDKPLCPVLFGVIGLVDVDLDRNLIVDRDLKQGGQVSVEADTEWVPRAVVALGKSDQELGTLRQRFEMLLPVRVASLEPENRIGTDVDVVSFLGVFLAQSQGDFERPALDVRRTVDDEVESHFAGLDLLFDEPRHPLLETLLSIGETAMQDTDRNLFDR